MGVPLNVPLHPTQLYESALPSSSSSRSSTGASANRNAKGAIISLYLMLYSAARFVVEFFRYHEQGNLLGGPLDTSQWISLVLFAMGGAYFLKRVRHTAKAV